MLTCEDCKKEFVFDSGEQKFFKIKGFTDPKRCPHCRRNLKDRMRRRKRPSPRSGKRHRQRRRSPSHSNSPYVDEY